jgi:hypothetical protein
MPAVREISRKLELPQSSATKSNGVTLDCFVATLLAMTAKAPNSLPARE